MFICFALHVVHCLAICWCDCFHATTGRGDESKPPNYTQGINMASWCVGMNKWAKDCHFLLVIFNWWANSHQTPMGFFGCRKVGVSKIGVPQNGWFIPIKMGWFGGKTHYFLKHPGWKKQLFLPWNPTKFHRFHRKLSLVAALFCLPPCVGPVWGPQIVDGGKPWWE